jgi:hypothetical protein
MDIKGNKRAIWLERYSYAVERMTQNAEITNQLADCITENFESAEDFDLAFQKFQQEIYKKYR